MTELLYMDDIESNYIREFEARVGRTGEDFVVLDRTAFYPKGGGQPSDTGKILWEEDESTVSKVEKKGDIIHRLEGEIPDEGKEVEGIIDWERRYNHMKLHTAQHLFSASAFELFGGRTAGNKIYTDHSRVDFEPVDLDEDDVEDLEAEVNSLIEEAHSVEIYEEEREELQRRIEDERVNLELLPDSIDILRVVDIDGEDICPCAGTHVRNTEEIKGVQITDVENKGKNTQRIYYELKEE